MIFGRKRYNNFEDLYYDNEKLVYVFIADYVDDFHLITELAQKVWYKVFLNWGKFEGKQKKEAQNYLRVMTKNLVIDYFKDKKKEDEMTEAFVYLYGKEDVTYLEQELEMFLEDAPEEYLEEALQILDSNERDLLDLRYKKKLQSEEIGALLGISAALARVRLQRIREKLRKEMERLLGANGDEKK